MLLTTAGSVLVDVLLSLFAVLNAGQVVNLGYASYQGSLNPATGNTIFLGIRYAAPPIGALRWQLPRTPETIAGTVQANIQPPGCPQGFPFRQTNTSSEDCLFLNVYTPQMPSAHTKSKPVVVWIHGGGYVVGSAAMYNGEDLIREANGGVVVVVIQYRLGVYGFLSGNEVKTGGSLNTGLRDQQFALQWVQKNIAKFGGNPNQVTIWGESAGAGSVLQHVIANDGKTSPPLFRAAITSSTYLPSQYLYNDHIPQASPRIRSESEPQYCTSASDTLDCLRTVDSATLQTINVNVSTSAFFGTFVTVPVVDGTFITQRPTKALQEHKVNGQALLSVTNSFEGFLLVNRSTAPTVQIPGYISQLFPLFGEQEIAKAAAIYAGLGAPIDQASAIMGESILICPTYFLMRAFKKNAFKGEFAIPPAHHGDDIQYYFPSQTATGFPAYNTDFDEAFSHAFLDFAMTLDPNIKSSSTITPPWKVWADGQVEMVFNKTSTGAPVVEPIKTSSSLLQRCSFWESVGELSGQ